MSFEIKDWITLIGISITLILGIVNIFIGLSNSKKTVYINTVTRLRSEWLSKMKDCFSDYANCCYSIIDERYDNINEAFISLKYKTQIIKLNLNYLDRFDVSIIALIDNITQKIIDWYPNYNKIVMNHVIDELIVCFQRISKYEWEGIKLESIKGRPSNRDKRKLLKEYLYTQNIPTFNEISQILEKKDA